MSRRPRIVSLYSGAGGMDYGFEAAGFETAVAVEMDPTCCETLRDNLPRGGKVVVERSIFDVPSSEILAVARAKPREIDVVIGGPPCQPFSKSGTWKRGDTRRLDDPRARTLEAYMRVVEDVLPRALVLENVSGLAFEGKSEGLTFLNQRLREINATHGTHYEPEWKVVCAASFGVPQRRERLILVAARDPSPQGGAHRFRFPPATHAPRDLADELGCEPHRTAWDALHDVRPEPGEDLALRGRWAKLLPSIPEGENYAFYTDRQNPDEALFGWRCRYWNFLLKLAKDRPSWTIQAQPGPSTGPFHWDDRLLSTRELCRLQTFPDSVEVVGGRNAVQRQVGNAVPSLLAEVIARAVGTQLLGRRSMNGPPRLVLARAKLPAPPPTARKPLAPEFRAMIRKRDPHPGTGKGPGAQSRLAVGA